jgi:ABC-type transport system involved in multi-copper enzyme maturation permease subunit
MSVYKRSYKSYTGTLTPLWSRFGVLTRYGLADVWSSRVTIVLFVLCMIPTVVGLVMIYIMNSDTVRLLLGVNPPQMLAIDNRFFAHILESQCWTSLLLIAWVGPRLMSVDLANNALPVILSRPISRAEYVLGKLVALLLLLSLLTWLPSVLLFVFQVGMSNTQWFGHNLYIVPGILGGAAVWMLVISLMSLAVASWVKWRIVATGLVFGATFVPAGIGEVFNAVLRTSWGYVLSVPYMMNLIWNKLLRVPGGIDGHPQYHVRADLPWLVVLIALLAIGGACLLALNTRVRAREVVRG